MGCSTEASKSVGHRGVCKDCVASNIQEDTQHRPVGLSKCVEYSTEYSNSLPGEVRTFLGFCPNTQVNIQVNIQRIRLVSIAERE